jgi:ABC-type transporter Mla maintaining outer membrane lipid asymmetry ATPase subunit MlaF
MAAGNGKADSIIIVRDLHRRFGVQQVLDGVNLDCPQGEVTTIVGPSGCGKTVLLKPTGFRPDNYRRR